MKRHTQVILYHLLPVVFWLLAIGGSLVPVFLWYFYEVDFDGDVNYSYFYGFLVAAIVMCCICIISRIMRHSPSVEQCFQVSVLLGIASYWLPSVIFLILPIGGYLIYQNVFSMRSFVAALLGFALVAVLAAVCVYLGWISNPWATFLATKNLWAWIPTGAVLLAWLSSTIAQQILRVR